MTEQEFLATQVMGWWLEHDAPISPTALDRWYYCGNNNEYVKAEYWNPRENIDQAMWLLGKFEYWRIYRGAQIRVSLYTKYRMEEMSDVIRDKLTDAIVDAVLEAKGYEKETN